MALVQLSHIHQADPAEMIQSEVNPIRSCTSKLITQVTARINGKYAFVLYIKVIGHSENKDVIVESLSSWQIWSNDSIEI